jgi:glycosyltransferase involved in cell wall biosynthesis
MARIAVITSGLPFGEGGHLVIVRALVQALREAGHAAEALVTPQNRFGRQGAAYLATWLTDVGVGQDGARIDQVITFRYPSYAVRHDAHACWLNHRMREYYDLWEQFRSTLTPAQAVKERIRRRLLHAADGWLLKHNVDKLFAQSATIAGRLERFGGIPAEVLYPPPPPRAYRCDRYGDYLFAVSRLTPLKRLDLMVRALARPEASGVRAVIAGEGEARVALQALVRELGLDSRVRFIGEVNSEQLVEHLAACRAVCFPPRAEDFGFVTVEAFAARKAVVTCTDSGGPAELVHDGVEGFVTPPTPEALAPALARLAADEPLASRMGEAGLQAVAGMTWSRAVERLVVV